MGKHDSEVHHLLLKIVYLNWVSKIKLVVKSLNKQKCSKFGSKAKFRGSENVFFYFILDSFSASAKI